ncbi:MAG TPA: hypothetical protein VMU19_11425 [Bryobacteraceae bacterium]|nr:hypothetical protein [Bryobacteraceae bacterium]
MAEKTPISVWFFTGVLLAFYGVVILAYGLATLGDPPDPRRALSDLRPEIWWGALLFLFGGFYTFKFYPRSK